MSLDHEAIRTLNDRFRQSGPNTSGWIVTVGVQGLGPAFMIAAVMAVRSFSDFNDGNDPYGEHDFGAIDLQGERVFWKIDYYDLDLQFGSENPADPDKTRRVLTIMLASEY